MSYDPTMGGPHRYAAQAVAPPHGLSATPERPPLPPAPYLIVGLGKAGTAAARALAATVGAAAVTAWDGAVDPVQRRRAAELRAIGVDVSLGGDGLDVLDGVRTLVKSPGVPPDIALVATAARRGLEIVDELDLGWRLLRLPTVGVTGTNGKSTTSALCMSLLEANGMAPALCGNTDFGPPLSELSLGPSPGSLVAEISSYQLEYSTELVVDGAIFTNLTADHLNRHADMDAYGAAKRTLFVRGDRAVPVAALNVDDSLGARLADEVEERGGRALRYGSGEAAEYRLAESSWGLREARLGIEAPDGWLELTTRLPGLHNAANATGVLALADGLGLPRDRTVEAIATAPPVPGRFEAVDIDRPFDVIVDLSVTAASVAAVLAAARQLVRSRGGRLLTVVAIVGRAGPTVGREVGAVARQRSDHLILSGASYRGEPRLVTLAELAAGARAARGGELELVIDRRAAIGRALELARPGDLVALLGRGPIAREAVDLRGGFRELDDRQVVRELA